jgi:uncharacterized protein YjiS (DUF1127 family)
MTIATAAPSGAGVLTTGSERPLGIRYEALRDRLNGYRAYRATVAELKALTDRQLEDLGILRAAIEQHARRAIYGN